MWKILVVAHSKIHRPTFQKSTGQLAFAFFGVAQCSARRGPSGMVMGMADSFIARRSARREPARYNSLWSTHGGIATGRPVIRSHDDSRQVTVSKNTARPRKERAWGHSCVTPRQIFHLSEGDERDAFSVSCCTVASCDSRRHQTPPCLGPDASRRELPVAWRLSCGSRVCASWHRPWPGPRIGALTESVASRRLP